MFGGCVCAVVARVVRSCARVGLGGGGGGGGERGGGGGGEGGEGEVRLISPSRGNPCTLGPLPHLIALVSSPGIGGMGLIGGMGGRGRGGTFWLKSTARG